MRFDLNKSVEILSRTPVVLETLLSGVSEEWLNNNEGENTWSPFDIVGHLIHGEKTDWIVRMEIILAGNPNKTFDSFDRFAQFKESEGKSMGQLLQVFKTIRNRNIEILLAKKLTVKDFSRKGIHPSLGEVTLEQLLSTWTTHDLGHLAQIARVMAKQYKQEVGPWIEYLPVLTR